MNPLEATRMSCRSSEELDQIVGWYALPRFPWSRERVELAPHLRNYLEVTFQPNRLEVISGGTGNECCDTFSRIATERGFPRETVTMFREASATFPDSILGIKLPFEEGRPAPPSLYVRSKCKKEKVFSFLLDADVSCSVLDELSDKMISNDCCYGLGFSELDNVSLIKTYTLDRVGEESDDRLGFRSHRLSTEKMMPVWKEYIPDTPIELFDPPSREWDELLQFLISEMKFRTAGHIGYERDSHGIAHPKIYVERKGAIPTDFGAR